jgi:thiamine-monophosphate kinase
MAPKVSDEMVRLGMVKTILGGARQSIWADSLIQAGVQDMDDAALVRWTDTESLVVTTDFVRGSGFYLFELGRLDYFDVGFYLIGANLSDIAAMGARPFALLTVIRYKNELDDRDFVAIFEGMKAAADACKVRIIGGDIGGHTSDVFSATALGLVKTENALLRRNVRDNDLLCVTGTVGLAITALTYFKRVKPLGFILPEEEEKRILLSWRRPKPRVNEGQILSENRLAHACQDVSDGLKATVEQMSAASGRTFTIYAERLPIDPTTRAMAEFLGEDCVHIACSASVDFELLFTMSRDIEQRCTRLFEEAGCTYTVIGEVNDGERNIIVDAEGKKKELPGIPWVQQTGDYLSDIVHKSRKL